MPDLSVKGIEKFWHEHDNSEIYKIISVMESVENWSNTENAELDKALDKLGKVLDNIGYVDLKEEDKFIQIANNLKIGHMLRIIQALDIAHPGAVAKLFLFAKENSESSEDANGLFLRRNIVFERLRALARVFAEDRLNQILQVLGDKK